MVKVREAISTDGEGKRGRNDDGKARMHALRSLTIPKGRGAQKIPPSALFRVIVDQLLQQETLLADHISGDKITIDRHLAEELGEYFSEVLKAQKEKRDINAMVMHQLAIAASKVRTATVAAQVEALLVHWAARYFRDLATRFESSAG